jgi:cell division septum initiation protein DivIVA
MAMDDLLDEGRTAFRTQWFGYDRRQVDEEHARLEGLLDLACADRDAALATAEELTRHLEEARSELTEYRTLHAGHSKDNAVSGCIRYLLHVARRKADEIESEARARAEDAVHRAEEAAGRHARLLDEAEQETQRRLAEASSRAREIVGEALEESRGLLADLRERQRLLDQWYAELSAVPDMPSPRSPEAEPALLAEPAALAALVAPAEAADTTAETPSTTAETPGVTAETVSTTAETPGVTAETLSTTVEAPGVTAEPSRVTA